jgi:hypothetical protein
MDLCLVAFAFIVGASFVVSIGWISVWTQRRAVEKRELAWGNWARGRGGRLRKGQSGFFGVRASPVADVMLDGVPVRLEAHPVQQGKSQVLFTRVQATARMPAYPVYSVAPAGLFSAIATAIGFQDVEVGDARFDPAFVVKADDEAAVRHVWSETPRRLMARRFAAARAWSDGRLVSLLWPGVELDPAILDAAAELVSTLSRAYDELLDQIRALPGATPIAAHPGDAFGAPSVAGVDLDANGTTIRIQAETRDGRLALAAHTQTREPQPKFLVEIAADGTPTPAPPEEVLPREQWHLLDGLGRATLVGSGKVVSVHWRGIPPNARVEAAIRVLPKLLGRPPAQGAFR